MLIPYHKIEKISGVCKKCSNINCSMERKWNKKHLKPHVSRARIKAYEEKIIKEQLNS
nr:MAG TPA: hypothetical protein [Caudoviricetes sp.]